MARDNHRAGKDRMMRYFQRADLGHIGFVSMDFFIDFVGMDSSLSADNIWNKKNVMDMIVASQCAQIEYAKFIDWLFQIPLANHDDSRCPSSKFCIRGTEKERDRFAFSQDVDDKISKYEAELSELREKLRERGDKFLLGELQSAVVKTERTAADMKIKLIRTFCESLKVLELARFSTSKQTVEYWKEVQLDQHELARRFPSDRPGSALAASTIDENTCEYLRTKHDLPGDWIIISAGGDRVTFGTVYAKAWTQVGGRQKIEVCRTKSEYISALVGRKSDLGQDPAFQALTIAELYLSGLRKLPTLIWAFREMQSFIQCQFPGVNVELILPPMKGQDRAGDKALMKYGNDVTRLRDLIRGTIVVHTDDLSLFYEILVELASMPMMRQEMTHWVSFEDRFLDPVSGGYSDTQWGVEVFGHQGEIQITTRAFNQAKSTGHEAYEDLRRKIESLLLACVRDLPALSRQLLETGANPNSIKDKHGLGPLHFAAMLGRTQTVQDLLQKGADPFKPDALGMLALHRALVEGHPGVVRILVAAMIGNKSRFKQDAAQCARLFRLSVEVFCMGWTMDVPLGTNDLNLLRGAVRNCRTLCAQIQLTRCAVDEGLRFDTVQLLRGKEWVTVTNLEDLTVDDLLSATAKFTVPDGRELMHKVAQIANMCCPASDQKTMFHCIALHGSADAIYALSKLEKLGSGTVVLQDDKGKTPFQYAIESGSIHAVQALCDVCQLSLADLSTQDSWCRTWAHVAAWRDAGLVIELLGKLGAPLNLPLGSRLPQDCRVGPRNGAELVLVPGKLREELTQLGRITFVYPDGSLNVKYENGKLEDGVSRERCVIAPTPLEVATYFKHEHAIAALSLLLPSDTQDPKPNQSGTTAVNPAGVAHLQNFARFQDRSSEEESNGFRSWALYVTGDTMSDDVADRCLR